MTQSASAAQIKKIHALARELRLDEDTRRDLMQRETGKRSAKDLDIREAVKVIDAMGRSVQNRPAVVTETAPSDKRPKARGALKLDGTFVPKIRALWISGYSLGIIREKTDEAMVAFVKRQTGVEHVRWAERALEEPAAARKVIEALKGWLARAADVRWGEEDPDGEGAKRAVYLTIRRHLSTLGVDTQFVEFPGSRSLFAKGAELDALTERAAKRLAKARAEAA